VKFYRYKEVLWSSGDFDDHGDWNYLPPNITVSETQFNLIKETNCGYWIQREMGDKKWVSKTSRKRYAYPSKEEALKGFVARKFRQISILTAQLGNAKSAMAIGENLLKGLGEE